MELFNINWSNYNREHSYTIGFLVHNSKWYFRYNEKEISNALDKGFRPFPDMNDINKTYESDTLFPMILMRYKEKSSMQIIDIIKNDDGALVTDKILIKHMPNEQMKREKKNGES